MMNPKLIVPIFSTVLLLTLIGRVQADEHANHDHPTGETVSASAAAQKLLGLRTQPVERRRIRSTVRLVGRFEQMPNAAEAVSSTVAGRIAIRVRPLQKVEAGDVLFTVTSPDLVARAREIAVLEGRLARYEATGAKNAALATELELRRSARAALVGAAEEKDGVVVIRAARAGIVSSWDLADGAYAELGARVLTLVDSDALWLKILVSPSDRARLRDGLPVSVGERRGTLRLSIGETDAVYVLFDERNAAWRAGVRVEAFCETDTTEKPVLAVPSAAIVQVGVRPIVFIKSEEDAESFIAFEAMTGAQGGGWTELTNLAEDDAQVVVQGQYELKLAYAASSGGGKKLGHFHSDGVFHEAGKD